MKIILSFFLLFALGLLIGQPILSNNLNETEKEKAGVVTNNKYVFDNGLSPLPKGMPKIMHPFPLPKGSLSEPMPNTPKYYSETEKQVNAQLDLIKLPLNPNFTENDVPNGVYVKGVKIHSGKQIFTIYSKEDVSKKQSIKVKIEESTLKVFVEDEKSNTDKDQHLLYHAIIKEVPEKYEVFRNGKIEKSKKIIYDIKQ
ncbi:hypothetical protein JMM81_10070 [Bacillus sp. V3B]|uniref:hypothetical protein n=1 Tax=Bacillus sp. V3B TaxID=2804915 RepID=UPI00210CAC98|nr:hypothetical protein [Bacillus sp. V3B]MCQ6275309.1 hypothetical protein [Bacillus sp. V3B]